MTKPDVEKIVEAFVELVDIYSDHKLSEPPMDNLDVTGVHMELWGDGSGRFILDTHSTIPGTSPIEKLTKTIMGSGEMLVEFENLDDLVDLLHNAVNKNP